MPSREMVGWILCGVSITAFILAKYVESRSRVDAHYIMEPEPDYPIVFVGDFGCISLAYKDFVRTEWLLDDPFDCLKELGLIGQEPSPKLDEPQIGEPE